MGRIVILVDTQMVELVKRLAKILSFNLNNASSVISETIHGVVLVPNGSFENKAVGAGWIVADSVTSGGTEWHCLSRDIPVVTSYAIKAKKTVNGKAQSGNEGRKIYI